MRIPFLLISTLWLGYAHAAPLTLPEADARLLEANPSIVLARSAVDAARAGIQSAGARPNPTLTVSASGSSPHRPGSSNSWDRATDNTIRIDQPIERGNKRDLRLRAADDNLSATRADLDNAVRLARSDLANAWVDLRAAQATARISAENARLAARAAEAAETRGKAGDLAGVDVARVAAEAARVANDAVQAEAQLAQARAALSALLGGRPPAASLELLEEWPADEADLLPTPAERPDILAARQRIAQADALRELARAQRTRDVSVGLQYEHAPANINNSYSESSVGISLSIPLFLGYDYSGEIARSEADYSAAEAQLAAITVAVDSERARLRSAYAASLARLKRTTEVILPAAERAGKGADIALQRGGMSLTDYLDTQRSLRAARLEAIQARADLARAAFMLRLAGDSTQ